MQQIVAVVLQPRNECTLDLRSDLQRCSTNVCENAHRHAKKFKTDGMTQPDTPAPFPVHSHAALSHAAYHNSKAAVMAQGTVAEKISTTGSTCPLSRPGLRFKKRPGTSPRRRLQAGEAAAVPATAMVSTQLYLFGTYVVPWHGLTGRRRFCRVDHQ